MTQEKHSVLVTGGNGFIASHIVSQLVKAAYEVTTSVRSEDQAKQLLDIHPAWINAVEFVFVPELRKPDAFVKAFAKPYDFVVHTASPVAFKVEDVQKDLIEPALQGTVGLLEAAHKLGGPRLKRFVLLSSAVAVLNSFMEAEGVQGRDYDEDDWNPVTAEDAIKSQDAVLGYNASKKMAEKAAWKFLEEHKTTFDLTVLNPDIVIGPMLHPIPTSRSVNESNRLAIYNFMDGTHNDMGPVRFPFYHFVDVRDVAKAHVLAMTAPKASNKRILLVSGLITPQLVVNTIRKCFKNLRDRVPEGVPSQILPEGVNPTGWNVSRSYEVFGENWTYKTLDESLTDTVEDLLLYENRWKAQGGDTAKRDHH